jgi:TM2 domain-containing membrane protein YozV
MGNIETVTAILNGATLYAAAGVVFALVFLALGVARIDNGAKGAGIAFRLLILPGLIALWPLMIIRWISGGQPHG